MTARDVKTWTVRCSIYGHKTVRKVVVTVFPAGVTVRQFGKDEHYPTRFPRLLAWRIGRQLRAEGYTLQRGAR
jgi:hypothetical protein